MFGRFLRLLAYVGGAGLLWLLGLTVFAVFMRKIVGSPLISGFDLSQVTLIVVVFSGIAYCSLKGGHVAVDLFSNAMPRGARRWVDSGIGICSAAVLGFLAWVNFIKAFEARELNEATMMVQIPYFPFILVIAAGFALYAITEIVLLVRRLSEAPGGNG